MRFDLSHKTAIVTGASQGIGKTIAIEMAKSGAIVFCLARNKEALDATIKKITESEKYVNKSGFFVENPILRNNPDLWIL